VSRGLTAQSQELHPAETFGDQCWFRSDAIVSQRKTFNATM